MAVGMGGDLFRRADRHHLPTAAFRPQVHDPVGGPDQAQGLIRIIPQFSKSATLRVAKVARRDRVMAAIWASQV